MAKPAGSRKRDGLPREVSQPPLGWSIPPLAPKRLMTGEGLRMGQGSAGLRPRQAGGPPLAPKRLMAAAEASFSASPGRTPSTPGRRSAACADEADDWRRAPYGAGIGRTPSTTPGRRSSACAEEADDWRRAPYGAGIGRTEVVPCRLWSLPSRNTGSLPSPRLPRMGFFSLGRETVIREQGICMQMPKSVLTNVPER